MLYTGIMPVLAIAAVRIYDGQFRGRAVARSRFELILAAGAGRRPGWPARADEIARHGGFRVWPVSPRLASPADLGHSLAVTGRGLLLLFGAGFLGYPAGLVAGLALAHLIGLGLAGWATAATIRRLSRADLGAPCSPPPSSARSPPTCSARVRLPSTRDITAVLPFGAALAGRVSPRR